MFFCLLGSRAPPNAQPPRLDTEERDNLSVDSPVPNLVSNDNNTTENPKKSPAELTPSYMHPTKASQMRSQGKQKGKCPKAK